ncbi:sucrase ferredoxin [Angustibacter sp. McL0619]|uniref:sucrase ferredoxin n=1 Tax=Angustibacter sp. McL0619 TaxID=3415676 RepID=UPI003CE7F76D
MNGPFRCADTARERDDPLVGTAAPARRWLLIEHPGPWATDALASSGIDLGVQSTLRASAGAAGARILLVRRPGRAGQAAPDRADEPRAWAVIDHASGAPSVWGTWRADGDLLAAAMALDPERAPSGVTHPATEPVLLVCTHGRHDTCCALRGRPVAAALAEHWPDWTWECSHVGGDRFAANVVLLPDGAYYGYLDPPSAVRTVQGHLRGQVEVEFLRGLSTEPPIVQAAVVAAMQRWGPCGARAFRSEQLGPVLSDPNGGAWSVELAGRPQDGVPARVSATVRRTTRAAELLTCQARSAVAATAYEVTDLREVADVEHGAG